MTQTNEGDAAAAAAATTTDGRSCYLYQILVIDLAYSTTEATPRHARRARGRSILFRQNITTCIGSSAKNYDITIPRRDVTLRPPSAPRAGTAFVWSARWVMTSACVAHTARPCPSGGALGRARGGSQNTASSLRSSIGSRRRLVLKSDPGDARSSGLCASRWSNVYRRRSAHLCLASADDDDAVSGVSYEVRWKNKFEVRSFARSLRPSPRGVHLSTR
jgi:hypothetical protein